VYQIATFFLSFYLIKSDRKRGRNEKNYFAKLVSYMKNVYHIERGFYKLADGRFNPTYSTNKVILPAFSFFT